MSKRTLVGVFSHESDLIGAVTAVRKAGLKIDDVYSPYAVHGLDRALGWKPSRLGWVCGLGGLTGAAFMLWFQWWTSAVSWPLNIGGKPWNSLPAFVPIMFEGMVLCAGLSSVFALFVVTRLRPGKPVTPIVPGAMNDRFVLLVNQSDATFDVGAVSAMLRSHHAIDVSERIFERKPTPLKEPAIAPGTVVRRRLNYALLLCLIALAGMIALAMPDPKRPNWDFLPDIVYSPAYLASSANPILPNYKTLQPPVQGTLAQGQQPLHYAATQADARRAGEELKNPLSARDAKLIERGAHVYLVSCMPCHGSGAQGDGPVTKHGYPAPPSLVTGNSIKMPDGQLFHIISYGRANMPPQAGVLSTRDRWAVILYIRSLQPAAASPPAETRS